MKLCLVDFSPSSWYAVSGMSYWYVYIQQVNNTRLQVHTRVSRRSFACLYKYSIMI